MVAVRYLPSVELGYDSDYLAGDQAQLITRVMPGSPAGSSSSRGRPHLHDGRRLVPGPFGVRVLGT